MPTACVRTRPQPYTQAPEGAVQQYLGRRLGTTEPHSHRAHGVAPPETKPDRMLVVGRQPSQFSTQPVLRLPLVQLLLARRPRASAFICLPGVERLERDATVATALLDELIGGDAKQPGRERRSPSQHQIRPTILLREAVTLRSSDHCPRSSPSNAWSRVASAAVRQAPSLCRSHRLDRGRVGQRGAERHVARRTHRTFRGCVRGGSGVIPPRPPREVRGPNATHAACMRRGVRCRIGCDACSLLMLIHSIVAPSPAGTPCARIGVMPRDRSGRHSARSGLPARPPRLYSPRRHPPPRRAGSA